MVETPGVVEWFHLFSENKAKMEGEILVLNNTNIFYNKDFKRSYWMKQTSSFISDIAYMQRFAYRNDCIIEKINFDQFFQDHIEDFL